MRNKSSKSLEKATAQAIQVRSTIYQHESIMDKYIRNIRAMNKATAYEYFLRLNNFQEFVVRSYKTTVDSLITKLKEDEDPYDILSSYVIYLQTTFNISISTLKARIITAKNFLEYSDVD
ncbi:MAG: hypothetical protein WAM42_23170, partial [Candidatus Nitrosopolaris sp.]